jgi:1-acyl-sn-glycerol-3-phosphate acyltransferase
MNAPMSNPDPERAAPVADDARPLAEQVLAVVREMAIELKKSGRVAPVALGSRLERELGFDSLARLELLMRLQRRLGVTVSEDKALAAETPGELVAALSATSARRLGGGVVALAAAEETDEPRDAATVIAALAEHAARAPGRVHLELYDGDAIVPLTYGELLAEGRRVAAGLLRRDVAPGESVALMLPTSRDFFAAFTGILLAGAVPVPIYPPFRASQLEDHLRRQALILENAQARLLIATPATARPGRWLRSALPGLQAVVTVAELSAQADGDSGDAAVSVLPRPSPAASDVALVQYTSGSTGDPKGVVLTHANLLANVRAFGEAADGRSTDVFVSWLPLYHDMGLIGAWLGSLYYGCRLVVMPPTRFLARPQDWLWAIHRHRGTISAAPNFAYEICASRIPDAELEGLDLSSWRLATNGAEPISPTTMTRFTERFARYGFRAESMSPVYGLAESTVGLSFTPTGRGPRVDRVARAPFEREGRAEPAPPDADRPLTFVSVGRPIPRHEIRVVDGAGHELPDRREGDIEFRGPSSTSGYLRNARATAALRGNRQEQEKGKDGWLVTGDRGYFAAGELHVTGRSKDLIIRAGRHVFPYELEDAVGAIAGVRRGGVAVFSCPDETKGTEKLVIVAETRVLGAEPRSELRARIEGRVAELFDTGPEEVVLVAPRVVPKTSSGKTRRAACREMYLAGRLGAPRSVRWQIAALAVRALVPSLRRAVARVKAVTYAAWFWLCLGLFALVAWVAINLVPRRAAWRTASALARAAFAAVGVPVRLRADAAPPGRPCVLAFNHASNLDALALVAALPARYVIVAKSELGRSRLMRRPLERLGVQFVERFDPKQGLEDTARLEALVREGQSLIVFPEGTNRRIPGLFPFRAGAFTIAARTRAPVVPGGITGTRTVLRPDQAFPRRAPIDVALGAPLEAESDAWEAVMGLRDRTREAIAKLAGEPLVGDG